MSDIVVHSKSFDNSILTWTKPIDDERYLLENICLDSSEKVMLGTYTAQRRRTEWLSTRYLLQQTLPDAKITYDRNGKPYLKNRKESIAISHCKDFISLFINLNGKNVGLDCETISSKVEKISHKFARNELSFIHSDKTAHLTVIWCAKEALFKLYSIGSVDFNEDLRIDSFEFCAEGGTFTGRIFKQNEQIYRMNYQIIGNCIFVWVSE